MPGLRHPSPQVLDEAKGIRIRWLLGLASAITEGMNDPGQDGGVDVSHVRVRLIRPGERAEWDRLMRAHHYLGLAALVGRSLRYVVDNPLRVGVEADGQWLALVGWASAALKCAPRDAWIGWAKALQWQRIGLIANNARFLILPGVQVRNLASRILGQNLARLSADWQAVHGHGLLLGLDLHRSGALCRHLLPGGQLDRTWAHARLCQIQRDLCRAWGP